MDVLAYNFILDEEEDEEENLQLVVARILLGLALNRERKAMHRRIRRLYLVRANLLPNPRGETPWTALHHSRDDRAFILTMGFDSPTFDYLLSYFAPTWTTTPIPRNDVSSSSDARPTARSLDAAGGLGLALHYVCSMMKENDLCLIFALTPTTVSRYLNFALAILNAALRRIPEAKVCWPETEEEYARLAAPVERRHPLLGGVFGSMDGLKLPVALSGDPLVENQNYNGWLHGHFIVNVFAFSTDGVIIAANINGPGSWHDSRMAEPIYKMLLERTPDGYSIAADTAFKRNGMLGRVHVPLKAKERVEGTHAEIQQRLALNREVVSFRQTAEWGMRSIQGSFSRLKMPLHPNDAPLRRRLLEVIVHLHNVRTRRVGLNQIRTTYNPIWQAQAEDRELWDGFENMMFGEIRRRDRVSRFHVIPARN